MGYQFIHVDSFAKVASKNKQKLSARAIANEAERVTGACPHVADPKPYKQMFGIKPSEAVELAESLALKATDSRGRKLRKDAQIILGGVTSYPVPTSQLDPNDKNLKYWLKLNHEFFIEEYGQTYKSCVLHYDEEFIHLHYYCVPDIDSNNRLNIGQVHCGVLARDQKSGESGKVKMRAYKQAMRSFQDRYYEKVGKRCGLTRNGANKRRLTRSQWKAEQATAKRLAESLKGIDFASEQFQKLEVEKASIKASKQELEKLKVAATTELKQARIKTTKVVELESKRSNVVLYLKNKVITLTKRIKSLAAKTSFYKVQIEQLNNEVSTLSKSNKKLEKVNQSLSYQNNLKDKELKRHRIEINSIIQLAKAGKMNGISTLNNNNNTMEYSL